MVKIEKPVSIMGKLPLKDEKKILSAYFTDVERAAFWVNPFTLGLAPEIYEWLPKPLTDKDFRERQAKINLEKAKFRLHTIL